MLQLHGFCTLGQIGYLGSFAIACNSLTGPAMLHLPATFHRSGLIPTLFTLCFVCVLTAACSLHMANTISKIPGNADFKKEVRHSHDVAWFHSQLLIGSFVFAPLHRKVEYAETFRAFWGPKSYAFTQALFFVCISCLNISSIVDVAQTVDTALGNYYVSVALQISWDPEEDLLSLIHWRASECSDDMKVDGTCLPYFDDGKPMSAILTSGYVICTVIFLPMALMDLKVGTLCSARPFEP
jgi:hypothetical protein